MTRVLVTGCRKWDCHGLAERVVARLKARYGPALLLVHGACPTGVDAAFDIAAAGSEVLRETYPADWSNIQRPGALVRRRADGSLYDAKAGPARNAAMVASKPAFVLAVHRDLAGSRGTKDCVGTALDAGIAVYLLDSDDAEPRRIRTV